MAFEAETSREEFEQFLSSSVLDDPVVSSTIRELYNDFDLQREQLEAQLAQANEQIRTLNAELTAARNRQRESDRQARAFKLQVWQYLERQNELLRELTRPAL